MVTLEYSACQSVRFSFCHVSLAVNKADKNCQTFFVGPSKLAQLDSYVVYWI